MTQNEREIEGWRDRDRGIDIERSRDRGREIEIERSILFCLFYTELSAYRINICSRLAN